MSERIPRLTQQNLNINYSTELYNCDPVPPYSFVEEMVRVTKPGGYICILHQLVYKTPKGTSRYATIPITTGPNMRIRVLNIFKKSAQARLEATN